MAGPTLILTALYAAYNRHDSDLAAALYAADGEHEDVAFERPVRGHEQIAAGLAKLFTSFTDAHWEPSRLAGGDEVEFGRYRLTATLHHDMGPFTARGQRLDLRGAHMLHTSDGRILRSEDFWDSASFTRQMAAP